MKKILVFIILFFCLLTPQKIFAETIHSFDTEVNAHKNGVIDIKETINYDFGDLEKHGIYRYIPIFSTVGDLYRIITIDNVRVLRDGENENFISTQDTQNLNLKIGNADKTISGNHIYEIYYSVANGIGSNFEDHDEVYWNATGNGWEVPIEKVTVKITNDFGAVENGFICFTGIIGSKDKSCQIDKDAVITTSILEPGEGLSVVKSYPVNTFPKSVLSKSPPQSVSDEVFGFIMSNIILISIVFNFILPLILIIWYLTHKNKKRFGPPAVNFDIPKDEEGNILRPAIAGTIDSAVLDRDDVTATIFDLAIRKYLKIKQIKQVKKLSPDFTDEKITKLKEADGLEGYEKILFHKLFKNGDEVSLSEVGTDFYLTFANIEKEVFNSLISKKYYIKNPKMQKGAFVFLGMFSLFFLNVILALVFFFLAIKLNGRTSLGDEIDFKIDGLKLFLKSMNRNYNWQAKNFYTVEQMIPYAVALGLINEFMDQLKIINPDYKPTWYTGYNGSFYNNYGFFYAATSSNLITSAPSSSSGMSGGGFSGGGGGGGGGGSW